MVNDPAAILSAYVTTTSQSWWTEQVARARLGKMGTARDQIRMISQEGSLASGWLAVTPSRARNTTLSDIDFRSLCRYWLGLPLMPDGAPRECPLCHETCDPFGDHFVNCRKNGWTRRHNAVRDEICNVLCAAGISHRKEVLAGGRDRPADVLLLSWDKGRDVCIDLTVVNPFTAESYPLSLEGARRHLNAAERDKLAKHMASCQSMGWGAHPVAFSPWGGAGSAAKSLVHELLKKAMSELDSSAKGQRTSQLRQNISLALAREVARQLSLRNRVIEESFD